MKKALVLGSLLLSLFLPQIANAAPLDPGPGPQGCSGITIFGFLGDQPVRDVNDIICIGLNIINFLLSITGGVFILMIVYGGIRYITSIGSPDNVRQARDTIFNAIIGLVIIILVLVLLNAVQQGITG